MTVRKTGARFSNRYIPEINDNVDWLHGSPPRDWTQMSRICTGRLTGLRTQLPPLNALIREAKMLDLNVYIPKIPRSLIRYKPYKSVVGATIAVDPSPCPRWNWPVT
jgi:hypothetical protein